MKTFVLLFALLSTQCLKATIKLSELCIIDGDTLNIDMYTYHRELLVGPFNMKDISKLSSPRAMRSNCFRCYIGTWTLVDSHFYLKNIRTDVGRKNINGEFETISGRKFTEKGMLADWITGTIYAGKQMRFPWVHSYEIALHLKKGKLISAEEFGSKEQVVGLSVVAQNQFLYTGIDRDVLKDQIKIDWFGVKLHVDKEGLLDSISLYSFDSSSTLHNQFLERIRSQSHWGQCFYKGEAVLYERSIFISTDKKARKRQAKLLR